MAQGQVVKLDRGFPLVKLDDGTRVRAEHSTDLVKTSALRAVVGDYVVVEFPETHDKGIIVDILPRSCEFVRKDPAERAIPQVLAANFDLVIVAQPLSDVNIKRLERELVLAFETGAAVAVVLTKADLADDVDAVREVRDRVSALVGKDVATMAVSAQDAASIETLKSVIGPGVTAVLIGKSGVGKSSLVNMLVGSDVQETGSVRKSDGKGRHTTVSREIVELSSGGRVIDMPGVRGLGMWEADAGIGAAFSDIEQLAESCRFRDCRHLDEPGCAVRAACQAGQITEARLASYLSLKQETRDARERREQAEWKENAGGRQAGPRKAGRARGRTCAHKKHSGKRG